MERGINMLKKHGITEATPSNIPLGAGTWFKGLAYTEGGWNGTVLGATSGGSSIKITPEVKDIIIAQKVDDEVYPVSPYPRGQPQLVVSLLFGPPPDTARAA